MCGRYKRPVKQKIAEAFAVSEGLEAFDLEPDDSACPQSFQPVIHLNENGERQMELMRWAFRLPDRLLFNARSEGIEKAKFWADSFQKRRCIIPASASRNRKTCPMVRRVTSTSSIFLVERYSVWPVYGSSGNIRRQGNGNRHSRYSLENQTKSCSRFMIGSRRCWRRVTMPNILRSLRGRPSICYVFCHPMNYVRPA
jgi:SOS response associated peptidase (SRAP)